MAETSPWCLVDALSTSFPSLSQKLQNVLSLIRFAPPTPLLLFERSSLISPPIFISENLIGLSHITLLTFREMPGWSKRTDRPEAKKSCRVFVLSSYVGLFFLIQKVVHASFVSIWTFKQVENGEQVQVYHLVSGHGNLHAGGSVLADL